MKRLAAFDIAKGIAMIAVIVGHCDLLGVPDSIRDFCFSFHMPLFFIVSGYFLKPTARLDRDFVAKSAKSLLIPYAVTCAIVVVLAFLKSLLFLPFADAVQRAVDFTLAALWGAGALEVAMPGATVAIGAVWFLLALFWARLFLAAANGTRYPLVVVLGLFAMGYCTSDAFWLPASIQAGMCCTLFVYVGQKVREAAVFERGAVSPLLWCTMLLFWLYCGIYCGKLYMVSNTYTNGIVDVIGGICGTLCIVKGAQLVSERLPRLLAPLELLGRNTLPVFCMHLVEIDVFPWVVSLPYIEALPGPTWVCGLALRVVLIAVMVTVLYFSPRVLSGVYFPSRKRPKAELTPAAGE